jgi:hypothetical protein
MVDLYDERDLVRVFASYSPQHAIGRCNGVAAAFDREFDYVFRVEVLRVGGERGSGRVLDTLIDRQDRKVARSG